MNAKNQDAKEQQGLNDCFTGTRDISFTVMRVNGFTYRFNSDSVGFSVYSGILRDTQIKSYNRRYFFYSDKLDHTKSP